MNKYILFFSEKCKFSQQFLNLIEPTPFNDLFVKISIHDPTITLPTKLKTVPTIIVPNINKPLEGDDVFAWIQQEYEKQRQQQQPTQQYQRQPQQYQRQPQQYQRQQLQRQQPPPQYQSRRREPQKSVSFLDRQSELNNTQPQRNRPMKPDFTKEIQPQTLNENDPQPFLDEMNSKISDNFSYIDTEQPLSHNFSFLEDTQEIQQNINSKQQSGFQNEMDNYLNSRDNDPYIGKSIARV